MGFWKFEIPKLFLFSILFLFIFGCLSQEPTEEGKTKESGIKGMYIEVLEIWPQSTNVVPIELLIKNYQKYDGKKVTVEGEVHWVAHTPTLNIDVWSIEDNTGKIDVIVPPEIKPESETRVVLSGMFNVIYMNEERGNV